MSKQAAKRVPVKGYAGVYIGMSQDAATGKPEKVFYIRYRLKQPDGFWKEHFELAGRQFRDKMTAKKASVIRARKMHGDDLPNRERRAKARAAKLKRSWTVTALWEEYRKARPGLKDNGSFVSIFNKYLEPHFGSKKPKEISALDIDRLKRRELKDKSPQTVAHVLELLRRLCNFGEKRGLCAGLQFTIEMPKVRSEKTEDLSPKQLTKLLSVIDGHIQQRTSCRQGAYMMRLALLTGMRRGETFKLGWDDIDWHRKNITLRKAKSGQDERIPMSSHAERLFKQIMDMEHPESSNVFPGRHGGQLVDIKRQVNQIKKQADLPRDFRPLHGLRHVFASMLVSHGVSLDVVSRLLTHKGRTVTSRYAHIRDDVLMQAAELAGEIIEKAGTEEASSVGAQVQITGLASVSPL